MLERPPSFWSELCQTMSNLVISIFPGDDVLKKEKNRYLWSPIVHHGDESMDEEGRDAGTSRYSSTMVVLLAYLESDGRWVWSAKQGAELCACLDEIVALINLTEEKRTKFGFRITEAYY